MTDDLLAWEFDPVPTAGTDARIGSMMLDPDSGVA